jgi:hypothetical protein
MPEQFATWRAFAVFEREVSRNRRYIRSTETEAFLEAVRAGSRLRISNVSEGRTFWRAQLGHSWRKLEQTGDEIPAAFEPKRMKPLPDRASEGRANSKGMPVLYVCSNKEAAMSEVRPWLGSLISLGRFVSRRKLAIVDCTRGTDDGRRFYFSEPPAEERQAIVWSAINRAFTKPVGRSDDTGDYVATQILAELFRDEGYDGIAYRSAFGERSVNFALFDLAAADLVSCELHEVTQAKLNFRERDNPYWVQRARQPKRKSAPS